MVSGFAIANFVLFIIALISVIMVFWTYYESRKDIEDNNDIIWNFVSKENEGRFLGSLISIQDSVPGRKLVTYKPRGLDLRTKKFKPKQIKQKSKPQTAIVDPEKIVTIPKGVLEQDKAIHILLPTKASDFPDLFIESPIGRAIVMTLLEKEANKTLSDMLEEGRINTREILKKINDGEATREMVQTYENLLKDGLKATFSDKDKKDKYAVNAIGGDSSHVQTP